jgi:hypothetical protein
LASNIHAQGDVRPWEYRQEKKESQLPDRPIGSYQIVDGERRLLEGVSIG